MNPDRRPSEDERRPDSESHPQSSSADAAAGGQSLRTFVSRSSLHAPSFQATEDANTESFPFPPLADERPAESSHRRRSSNASQNRPDLYRSQSRNPSIRIRRRSNVSLRPPSQRSSIAESIPENPDDAPTATLQLPTGRARSVSQPERGTARADPVALARHSRAVPQVAMPRLTEESTRPTMDELGFDRTPPLERTPSPAVSLPEMSSENHHPGYLGRMRRMSKFFWPGGRADGGQPSQDAATAQRNAEYDDELVDFLDVVGTRKL